MKLSEEYLTSAKDAIASADFYRDPSIKEYSNLESYQTYNEVKGILTSEHLYVWNDHSLFHLNAIKYLENDINIYEKWFPIEIAGRLGRPAFISLTVTAQLVDLPGTKEDLKLLVKTHPIINSLFPNSMIAESAKLKRYKSLFQ